MMDLMHVASLKQAEFETHLCNQSLHQARGEEQAEYRRFLQAYRLRSLLNRFAPSLAPRLGF
ncbi:MAG: hypothetical protein ACOY94_15035 [Bacillota bacterium]